MAEPLVITSDDVQRLNRTVIERSSAFVRIAGTALIVVGVFGVVAFIWFVVRSQQQLSDQGSSSFGSIGPEVDLLDRIDLITPYVFTFVIAALALGFGMLLRLVADVMVDRSGGTLTGFEPGDAFDDDEEGEADGEPELTLDPVE